MFSLLIFGVMAVDFWPYRVFADERYSETENGIYHISHCRFVNLQAYDIEGGGGAVSVHNQLAKVNIYRSVMENCTAWQTDPATNEIFEQGYGGSAAIHAFRINIEMTGICQSTSNGKGGSLSLTGSRDNDSQANCTNVCVYQTKGSWGDFYIRLMNVNCNSINWSKSVLGAAGPIGAETCYGISVDYSQSANVTSGSGYYYLSDIGKNNSMSMCNMLYMNLEKINGLDAGSLIEVDNAINVWTIIRECTMIECTHHLKTKHTWMISKLVDIDECYSADEDPEMDWDACDLPSMVGNVTDSDELREISKNEWNNMYCTRRFTATVKSSPIVHHTVLRGGLFVWLLNV